MTERASISRITAASPDVLNVSTASGTQITLAAWTIACLPAIVCLLGFILAWYERYWLGAAILGFIVVSVVGLLVAILSLNFQTQSRLILSSNGITERKRTVVGTRHRHIYPEDILELRAAVQGQNYVRLTADTRSCGTIPLVTVTIDDFNAMANHISALLSKSYVLMVNCPAGAVMEEQSNAVNPDFVRVDPFRRKIVLEYLGATPIEAEFDDIATLSVEGPFASGELPFGLAQTFEYVYQPTIHFRDGSTQPLQRFRSFEESRTDQSEALLSATRFAKCLERCVSADQASYTDAG